MTTDLTEARRQLLDCTDDQLRSAVARWLFMMIDGASLDDGLMRARADHVEYLACSVVNGDLAAIDPLKHAIIELVMMGAQDVAPRRPDVIGGFLRRGVLDALTPDAWLDVAKRLYQARAAYEMQGNRTGGMDPDDMRNPDAILDQPVDCVPLRAGIEEDQCEEPEVLVGFVPVDQAGRPCTTDLGGGDATITVALTREAGYQLLRDRESTGDDLRRVQMELLPWREDLDDDAAPAMQGAVTRRLRLPQDDNELRSGLEVWIDGTLRECSQMECGLFDDQHERARQARLMLTHVADGDREALGPAKFAVLELVMHGHHDRLGRERRNTIGDFIRHGLLDAVGWEGWRDVAHRLCGADAAWTADRQPLPDGDVALMAAKEGA